MCKSRLCQPGGGLHGGILQASSGGLEGTGQGSKDLLEYHLRETQGGFSIEPEGVGEPGGNGG